MKVRLASSNYKPLYNRLKGEQQALCGYTQQQLIPNIPVLPLSYADAAPLLRSLGGPAAPPDFVGALNLTYKLGPSVKGIRAKLVVHNSFNKVCAWPSH